MVFGDTERKVILTELRNFFVGRGVIGNSTSLRIMGKACWLIILASCFLRY